MLSLPRHRRTPSWWTRTRTTPIHSRRRTYPPSSFARSSCLSHPPRDPNVLRAVSAPTTPSSATWPSVHNRCALHPDDAAVLLLTAQLPRQRRPAHLDETGSGSPHPHPKIQWIPPAVPMIDRFPSPYWVVGCQGWRGVLHFGVERVAPWRPLCLEGKWHQRSAKDSPSGLRQTF
ncbi:hypothetical protein BGW80DRAFT_511419 [Lactifluus volemus]|nr:hypothetical protein BGW80DRAFT_511419 [Lactifluus volemus]